MVETTLSQPSSIPVYRRNCGGRLTLESHMTIEAARAAGAHFVRRSRDRRIERAILPDGVGNGAQSPHLLSLSRKGMAYQQQIATGFVWALRGVRGS